MCRGAQTCPSAMGSFVFGMECKPATLTFAHRMSSIDDEVCVLFYGSGQRVSRGLRSYVDSTTEGIQMKRIVLAVGMIGITLSTFAADVGVSMTVGEPGFYGRIDLGTLQRPQVIYEKPIIIQAQPQSVRVAPIYLRVPPGHAKKWSKHCHRYQACGQPVYFVQDNWYSNVYVPEYRHAKGHDGKRGDDGDDQGNGSGKVKGHGKQKKDKD